MRNCQLAPPPQKNTTAILSRCGRLVKNSVPRRSRRDSARARLSSLRFFTVTPSDCCCAAALVVVVVVVVVRYSMDIKSKSLYQSIHVVTI